MGPPEPGLPVGPGAGLTSACPGLREVLGLPWCPWLSCSWLGHGSPALPCLGCLHFNSWAQGKHQCQREGSDCTFGRNLSGYQAESGQFNNTELCRMWKAAWAHTKCSLGRGLCFTLTCRPSLVRVAVGFQLHMHHRFQRRHLLSGLKLWSCFSDLVGFKSK